MKTALGLVLVVVVLAGGYWYYTTKNAQEPAPQVEQVAQQAPAIEGASVVVAGNYSVNTTESTVAWEGKKPLIDGYVNSGTIKLQGGDITAGTSTASGAFTIDMNSLTVDLTAKKPGKENALETHLKTGDFFDVTKYPTATFTIKSVTPRSDSATSFTYDVRGDLKMKDKTNEISFPAQIYMKDGNLHVHAETSIDRTKWGITFGSGNFFENLADNAIDDMVALSFKVVANKK